MVTLLPATLADFEELGNVPPYRTKAWTARKDGQLLGVGGAMILPDGVRYAFVDMKPGIDRKRYALAIHKAGKAAVKELVRMGGGRIVATMKNGTPRAREWLLRLGFEECGTGGGNPVFVLGEK